MTMRIAVFQGPAEAGTPADNLAVLDRVAGEASERGAKLLVAPEMFLTGYAIGPDAVRRLAEPVHGSSATAAAGIARRYDIALCYGYPEASPAGEVYNAAILLGRDGSLRANHRKSHLFGELDHGSFAAGDTGPTMADLDGFKVGLMICYDVEFPENVRALLLAGADLALVPTALMQPYDFIARRMVPTRAFENQIFLAYANRCGAEADLRYVGLSCVIGPDGSELARAGEGEELLVADLDPDLLAASRALNTYGADRRPELYGELARTPSDPR